MFACQTLTADRLPSFGFTQQAMDATDIARSSNCHQFLSNTEMCSRLSPPPVPPWLQDTQIGLRNLATNCSGWRIYKDLCSLQVPAEYRQALSYQSPGTTVAQWIPLIIALLTSALILACVGLIYFLHQSNRLSIENILDKYLSHCHKKHTSKTDGQIKASFCQVASTYVLEDDYLRNKSPAQMLAYQLAHGRNNIDTSDRLLAYDSSWQKAEEVILLPEHLQHNSLQSAFNVLGNDYYSLHSLSTDADCEELLPGTKHQQPELMGGYIASSENGHMSCFVELHVNKRKQSFSHGCDIKLRKHSIFEHYNYRTVNLRAVIQRCRQAGSSLVHGVASWNRGSVLAWSRQVQSATTLVKLRQSVYKRCTSRPRFYQTSKVRQTFQSSSDIPQIYDLDTQSYACSSVCMESVPDRKKRSAKSIFSSAQNRLRQVTAGKVSHHGEAAKKLMRKTYK